MVLGGPKWTAPESRQNGINSWAIRTAVGLKDLGIKMVAIVTIVIITTDILILVHPKY